MYITPSSFLDQIHAFRKLIGQRQRETNDARNRYLGGLSKLAFAAQQVNTFCRDHGPAVDGGCWKAESVAYLVVCAQVHDMQVELEALQPKLVAAAQETEEMVRVIEIESAQVSLSASRPVGSGQSVSQSVSRSNSVGQSAGTDQSLSVVLSISNLVAAVTSPLHSVGHR